MKKKKAKFLKMSMCIFIVMTLSACWSARELNDIAIVMGVGIDKAKELNELDMTVQVVDPTQIKGGAKDSTGNGGRKEAFINLENTGITISEALKGINRKLDRELFFSDNQIIVIGKSLAEEGIGKKLDFFLRHRETRLLVWVLVSKETAREVLDISPKIESISANNIAELIKIEKENSQITAVNLKDFSAKLMSKTTAPVAPMIEVVTEKSGSIVYIAETAVFKKDKMIGKLDNKETKGYLWITNEVKRGIIELAVPNINEVVSLETTRSKSKITPKMKDGKIVFNIEIKEEGDLADQLSIENLAKPAAFEKLEKSKAASIKNEIMAAVKRAKELNADIFGFGDKVHQHYPKEWKKLQYEWDKIFPEVEVEVKVEAKLRRSGRITKPIMSKDEEG
jgi:Ger(x)C family germination protein